MIHKIAFKKAAIILALSLLMAFCFDGCSKEISASSNIYKRQQNISSPSDAKKLLIEGNQRFISGKVLNDDLSETKRNELSTNGQQPFAIIVGCSDSRVPPEILFDQALGDIFVIRDAGNVIDPVSLGSIEYGAEHLKAPLIVVLGHEKCGAVKATVDGSEVGGSIKAIVEKIKPSRDKFISSEIDKNALYVKTEDENVKSSIEEIRKSPIIKQLEEEKKLEVVGAKYDIDTGEVKFF